MASRYSSTVAVKASSVFTTLLLRLGKRSISEWRFLRPNIFAFVYSRPGYSENRKESIMTIASVDYLPDQPGLRVSPVIISRDFARRLHISRTTITLTL